nr:ethanolamine utilization protein EutH [uncultured Propionibacterium sp.]
MPAKLLKPMIVPVHRFLGADPSMFAGTLLVNDMGVPLGGGHGRERAGGSSRRDRAGRDDGVHGRLHDLGIVDARYRSEFANGVLVGVVTIPVGVPAGVLVAGFPVVMVLANLVPIVLAAVLIAIGLWRVPDAMTKGFLVLGKFLVVIISLALAVGSFEFLTERGPCRPAENSPPVMDGMTIVAQICLFLMGAFVLMDLIVRVGGRPLASFGRVLGINEVASGGSVVTMADAIPTFQMMKDMDRRGSSSAPRGRSRPWPCWDHLGFTAGVAPRMIAPTITGELAAAAVAVLVACAIARRRYPACRPGDEGPDAPYRTERDSRTVGALPAEAEGEE